MRSTIYLHLFPEVVAADSEEEAIAIVESALWGVGGTALGAVGGVVMVLTGLALHFLTAADPWLAAIAAVVVGQGVMFTLILWRARAEVARYCRSEFAGRSWVFDARPGGPVSRKLFGLGPRTIPLLRREYDRRLVVTLMLAGIGGCILLMKAPFALPLAGVLFAGAAAVWLVYRHRIVRIVDSARTADWRLCPGCGYSLTAGPLERCPECGVEVSGDRLREVWGLVDRPAQRGNSPR